MQILLSCSRCIQSFFVPSDSPAAECIERMAEQGPWSALGDGETLEDKVFTTLSENGSLSCPECGSAAQISEASLGRFTRELLMQW